MIVISIISSISSIDIINTFNIISCYIMPYYVTLCHIIPPLPRQMARSRRLPDNGRFVIDNCGRKVEREHKLYPRPSPERPVGHWP